MTAGLAVQATTAAPATLGPQELPWAGAGRAIARDPATFGPGPDEDGNGAP